MLLPDTVGTGGDSHTRFRSVSLSRRVLVWWRLLPQLANAAGYAGIRSGALQRQNAAGITLRDLVHAIPLYAIKQGLRPLRRKARKTSSLVAFWKLKSAGSES